MQENNLEQTEILEEGVVVDEIYEATEDTKKAKIVKVSKTVLKVVGIATLGVISCIAGAKVIGKMFGNNDSEIIEQDSAE